jgi:hypothetical protein
VRVIGLLLTLLVPSAAASAAPPPTLHDLAGIWVAGKALHIILEKRSPHAAVAESVTITPASSGASGRLDWNDGHEGSWRRIVGVETPPGRLILITGPWEQEAPGAKDLVRVFAELVAD